MPTGSLQAGCVRVCPQASELGPGSGSASGSASGSGTGSGSGPELPVWGMVYALEESVDKPYLAPRASGLPEWCEPLLSRTQKEKKQQQKNMKHKVNKM